MDAINNRIKDVRKYLNLSQDLFGQKIGITSSGISKLEKGERSPSSQTILSIVREFGVNQTWLETGEREMFQERTEDQLLISAVGKQIKTGNPFAIKFLRIIAEMDEQQLAYVEDLIDQLAKKE